MFETFREDARRWVVPGEIAPASAITLRRALFLLYRHISLRAMLWFRFGSWCHARRIPGLPSFVQRHLQHRYGLEILISCPIGGGLYIAHPVGTVISARSIGRNCSLISAVTIGLRNDGAFPALGDDVYVGAGARVLGDISIGDGARIGANAVVLDDVPAGATAVGIPARCIAPVAEDAGGV